MNVGVLEPNDPDDADSGPNKLQNSPELISAEVATTSSEYTYSVNSAITNSSYPLKVEFYVNNQSVPEGRTYVTEDTYTEVPGTPKTYTYNFAVHAGKYLTAIAIDTAGNTSEFSTPILIEVASDDVFEDGFESPD